MIQLLGKCDITLPQYTTDVCKNQRKNDIIRARKWYVLTDEKKPTAEIVPLRSVPVLNQTQSAMHLYYAMDPFLSRYFTLYTTWVKISKTIYKKIAAGVKTFSFDTYKDYNGIYHKYLSAIKVSI